MQQHKPMTLDEKLATSNRAFELLNAGDREGYHRLMKTIPIPPYMAKVIKDKIGLDILLQCDRNLYEVEAEFGSAWLNQ